MIVLKVVMQAAVDYNYKSRYAGGIMIVAEMLKVFFQVYDFN